jgi:hypothetical protein
MKRNLQSITLKSLRNNLHFEFLSSILALLLRLGAGIVHIAKLLVRLKELLLAEDVALDQTRRYDATGRIHEEDHRRDSAFYSIRDALRAFSRHFDAAKREAALRLDLIFEDFKNAPQKALPDESADIHNLLQRLENYLADIDLLGLGDWILELRQANDSVRLLTAERDSEAAARATLRMKTIRAEVDQTYYEIIGCLEAAATLEGLDAYSALFAEINARITEYNNILAREKGRRNSKTATDEAVSAE